MGPRERPHCFLGGAFSWFVICGSGAARLGDGGLDFPARLRYSLWPSVISSLPTGDDDAVVAPAFRLVFRVGRSRRLFLACIRDRKLVSVRNRTRARYAAAAWDQALADDRDRGKRRGLVLSVVRQRPRLGQCRPGHDQPDAEDSVAVAMHARPDQPRRRSAGAAFADDRLAPRRRRGRSHRHRDAALSPDDELTVGAKSTPCGALWLHRIVLPAKSREAKHWMQYSAPS